MDVPTLATAKVDQGGREKISRCRQRDELRNTKPSPSRKAAVDQQPTVSCSNDGSNECASEEQGQGSSDLTASIRSEAAQPVEQTLQPFCDEVEQWPYRQ